MHTSQTTKSVPRLDMFVGELFAIHDFRQPPSHTFVCFADNKRPVFSYILYFERWVVILDSLCSCLCFK